MPADRGLNSHHEQGTCRCSCQKDMPDHILSWQELELKPSWVLGFVRLPTYSLMRIKCYDWKQKMCKHLALFSSFSFHGEWKAETSENKAVFSSNVLCDLILYFSLIHRDFDHYLRSKARHFSVELLSIFQYNFLSFVLIYLLFLSVYRWIKKDVKICLHLTSLNQLPFPFSQNIFSPNLFLGSTD